MGTIEESELRRRAIEGLRDEVEAFGSGHPEAQLIRREGLLATLVAATPERSLFNSVYYEDAEALFGELDALKQLYEEAGVRAWTVWVPDEDRETARRLAARGHLLDASPRAMALDLAELAPAPPTPAGVEMRRGDAATCAALNDRAYGYGPDGFRTALAGETTIRWYVAWAGEEPVSCIGGIAIGDDVCITGVATPPEHRGRGIAGWLLCSALDESRRTGMATSSLQATKAGAPLYERLGFLDLGYIEMWELRR
jgi:GNAT superfamily N-acetyltransferase